MYPWAWTWNPLGGKCLYKCIYCYVENKIAPWLARMGCPKYLGPTRLLSKELVTRLRKPDDGKVIFVQSNGDLFGYWVFSSDISLVLAHCREYPDNTYLFQSKNPGRFLDFINDFPPKTILGTTLETNRNYNLSAAPGPRQRYKALLKIEKTLERRYPKIMVSLEPLIDFDLLRFVSWIENLGPAFVSVGADTSKHSVLAEPSVWKVRRLLSKLEGITEVRVKKNLQRLLKKGVE